MLKQYHQKRIYQRRVSRLVDLVQVCVPSNARVLDLGCGDGLIASLIAARRGDISIQGIDVLIRPHTHIQVTPFDGVEIPFEDQSFDAITCIDVLHHTKDPMVLLREMSRVARSVVIKDHLLNGLLAGPSLRFMDYIGNAKHGVDLPYNYWPSETWQQAFNSLGWSTEIWQQDLEIYPAWLDWWFGRQLHFVARFGTTPS